MAFSDEADLAGLHACQAALDAGHLRRLMLPAGKLNKRQAALLDSARQQAIDVQRADAAAFAVAAPAGLRHQGALAWTQTRGAGAPADLDSLLEGSGSDRLILILDGIEDPRNLGACLRCADGAGVDAVIVPRNRSAPLSAIARKTAAGAAEALTIIEVANLAQALRRLQQAGIRIVGLADASATDIYAADLKLPLALVMGNEGQGLRQLTQQHCDELLSLPMHGSVSSLNVSVATGVALYEVRRRSTQL